MLTGTLDLETVQGGEACERKRHDQMVENLIAQDCTFSIDALKFAQQFSTTRSHDAVKTTRRLVCIACGGVSGLVGTNLGAVLT
jgi:hypothetical protein